MFLCRSSLTVLKTLPKGCPKNVRSLSSSHLDKGIFNRDVSKTSGHSSLLAADSKVIYEMVVDSVQPKDWEDYIKYKGTLVALCNERKDHAAKHLASFHYIYGDRIFRAMHLYSYANGWADLDKTRLMVNQCPDYLKEYKSGLPLINQQQSEFMKSFMFWPTPEPRTGKNIYDLRSYQLKPGSMYDWGNYWAKGINYRKSVREDIPYGGFFTQMGELSIVYHIWVYKDLVDRNQCRTRTWDAENWADVVSNTVPLINSMKTRILEPLPFSPTQ